MPGAGSYHPSPHQQLPTSSQCPGSFDEQEFKLCWYPRPSRAKLMLSYSLQGDGGTRKGTFNLIPFLVQHSLHGHGLPYLQCQHQYEEAGSGI